ncbi:MAG: hypothetical protein GY857_10970, partial [Desulfobacula sp.]|nr:hypothetical protein [Desulfobacula sp.]
MLGAFEHNSITGKIKYSGRTVQKRLLIPLACVLILLIVSFCTAIIYTQKKALEQSSLQRLENAAKMLSQVMEAQSQVLTALENIMLGNV